MSINRELPGLPEGYRWVVNLSANTPSVKAESDDGGFIHMFYPDIADQFDIWEQEGAKALKKIKQREDIDPQVWGKAVDEANKKESKND